MPRQSRIDTFGALHHIICCGIERREIFSDDTDRDELFSRLGRILTETSAYAAFVADGVEQGKRTDLIGGGLVRSAGGWQQIKTAAQAGP